jgi:putative ABC transport system ATP-binding protein
MTERLIGERTPTALLRAVGVRKWYGSGTERITPVDGVDLTLVAGEIVVITGPSGSGKTTLLQMVAGFVQPDEGAVHWPGTCDGAPAWHEVALVPQSLGLLPELSAMENIALPLLSRQVPTTEVGRRVAAMLAELDVDHLANRLVGETSLGQQQRVAVARALIGRPLVVIADEPISHQDGDHATTVLSALRRATNAGAACLVAGHDPRLPASADRVLHLDDGTLASGS